MLLLGSVHPLQVWLSGSSGSGRPKSVEVTWAEAEIRHATKKLLKRISSDKKKLKQEARSVARLAHSSPVVVLEAILNNAVAYDNQIAPLVECCAFMTPFALDCASFMMVSERLHATSGVGLTRYKLCSWACRLPCIFFLLLLRLLLLRGLL